jgi:hypothetical protein
VKTDLPQDISDFAAVATKRLTRLGGPPAALRAETDDQVRQSARAALSEVGAFELDVRSAADDLLAAAVLCQAAGATALPYPLVEELLMIDGASITAICPATGSAPTWTATGTTRGPGRGRTPNWGHFWCRPL